MSLADRNRAGNRGARPTYNRVRPKLRPPADLLSSTTSGQGATVQASTSLCGQDWQLVRSAYTTAYYQGTARTFEAWVTQALRAWEGMTPRGRRAAAAALPHAQGPTRQYTLQLPASEVQRVDGARAPEQTSRSRWIALALRHAAEQVRVDVGGPLPPAPTRLPHH